MLLVNCLFRAGGAAALMTNTKRGTGARYVLEHCERTHWASTQEGYDCMGDGEDADGKKGHFIRRSLLPVATEAIKFHLKRLAPHVLTWGELRKAAKDPKYVPRFGKGFEHLLLHTGGERKEGREREVFGVFFFVFVFGVFFSFFRETLTFLFLSFSPN
jgi:3-ketoacyl-CoA synthase